VGVQASGSSRHGCSQQVKHEIGLQQNGEHEGAASEETRTMRQLWALLRATREEEQAVSVTVAGPLHPNT
jgi:hypothetical protein